MSVGKGRRKFEGEIIDRGGPEAKQGIAGVTNQGE